MASGFDKAYYMTGESSASVSQTYEYKSSSHNVAVTNRRQSISFGVSITSSLPHRHCSPHCPVTNVLTSGTTSGGGAPVISRRRSRGRQSRTRRQCRDPDITHAADSSTTSINRRNRPERSRSLHGTRRRESRDSRGRNRNISSLRQVGENSANKSGGVTRVHGSEASRPRSRGKLSSRPARLPKKTNGSVSETGPSSNTRSTKKARCQDARQKSPPSKGSYKYCSH
ncbi:unnamed protein product [Protopolystoma xenopodis]|uniref:Uncharacterized protein n=1 Tax=Protopolystoma xenopodis TaxID=117903 RepID=A0A448WHT7_9PLAT|nr:unnamed protein product [Protopolystoma xenopodis]